MVLFRGNYFREGSDLHPDGERLVIAQEDLRGPERAIRGASERFIVVTNWFEELRERMGEN